MVLKEQCECLVLAVHYSLLVVGPIFGWPILILLLWLPSTRLYAVGYLIYYFYVSKLDVMKRKSYSTFMKWYRRHLGDYFNCNVVNLGEMPANKNNIIVGIHPHGFAGESGIKVGEETSSEARMFKGYSIRWVVATFLTTIPFVRDYVFALGSVDCSESTIVKCLNSSKATLMIVAIGGGKEMYINSQNPNYLVLQNRKGFCRIALKTGSYLLPSYTFRVNELYEYVKFSPSSIMGRIENVVTSVTSNFGYPLTIYSRNFRIWWYLPRRGNFTTVFGEPIVVQKVTYPTVEQIDELHANYVSKILDIFDKYKHKYGDKNATLTVI